MYVVSFEERKILEDLKAVCERRKTTLLKWDPADFFQTLAGSATPPEARDALAALEAIEALEGRAVVLLPDFHQCWHDQPKIVRKLRNLAHALKYTHKTLVVTSPARRLPEELEDDAALLDYPSPDVPDLKKILAGLLSAPGTRVDLTRGRHGKARALGPRSFLEPGAAGLRESDRLRRSSRQGRHRAHRPGEAPDRPRLGRPRSPRSAGERRRRRRARGLEAVAPAPGERLQRGGPRLRPSRAQGIALIGIPGTGKSLTAKMVAGLFRLPLVRLDLGALYGRFVGESEENSRRALRLAETIAPCVLWIDELEKGIATGDNDGGTSLRVLATLLSWMQEKTKPVFVVATANDISKLPPSSCGGAASTRSSSSTFRRRASAPRSSPSTSRSGSASPRDSTSESSRPPPRATWARRSSRRSSTRCTGRSTIPNGPGGSSRRRTSSTPS